MRLVTRYILSHFRRIFLLALGSFVGLFLVVEFFDKVDNFVKHQARLSHYLLYFSASIPQVAVQVAPLAMLLAVFLTVGGLSRTNELTAMRSGGISLWRLTSPLLGLGLLVSLAIVAANETLVPISSSKADQVMQVEVKGRSENLLWRRKIWFRTGNTFVNIQLFDGTSESLTGVSIFKFDSGAHLVSRLDAPRGSFTDGGWLLEEVTERSFAPESGEILRVNHLPSKALSLGKTPDDFRIFQPKTEEMTYRELKSFIRKLRREGYNPTRYRVDLEARLATPFASLIMAFLGIPFALQRGRGTSLAIGVGLSIGIGIAFYLTQATLQAFGYSGVLPPAVAAWGANILFLLGGIWLLLATRE